MIRKQTEHLLQCQCIQWFRLQYPDRLFFAVPNGGARDNITGAMLKREGVVAGVPDICIPEPSNGFHGLFIEMKIHGGQLRHNQKTWQNKLRSRGYCCAVCWSFEDFTNTVKSYLNA